MKNFGLFNLYINKNNYAKSRKVKLLTCSLLLVISFTVVGYRTISLASIKKDNTSKKTVLFSPSAASFDTFKNFEDRGKYFNKLIKKHIYAR